MSTAERPTTPERCLWCARTLPEQEGVGRRRKYCRRSCRQRAYEERTQVGGGELPSGSVVLTRQERDDLADRLYQMVCAAEDVATALTEAASRDELQSLTSELLRAARAAERIR